MNDNNLNSIVSKRIVWADLLRFVAIMMVICIHCSDPFNVSPEARSNPEYNLWGSIYGAFLRPCVPLFVMLTGMLLLPIQQDMGQFYKKRMMRVIVPFLIWSLLYNLFPLLTGITGWDSSILTKMFAYAGENPSQSWESSLHNIYMIPFNFNVYTIPLWYIYMLIGLYLFMPFFSAWLKQATDKQMKVFLFIWGITLFLPYCNEYISNYILGTCAWNNFGTLYYFAGFNGYLLLGYYLNVNNKLTIGKTIILSVILFVIGYVITYIGFRDMTSKSNISEEQMELFFLYCTPNVLLMTVAVFILVQKIQIRSPFITSILSNITKCGLGIYMIHYFIVGIGYLIIEKINLPIAFQIPTTGILVFILSWGIVSLFYRFIPKYAKWIMG
ncbi:acyltransferase [Bacteroides fragilis]|nr:acyltransferase [Bacteroides fragilis]